MKKNIITEFEYFIKKPMNIYYFININVILILSVMFDVINLKHTFCLIIFNVVGAISSSIIFIMMYLAVKQKLDTKNKNNSYKKQ